MKTKAKYSKPIARDLDNLTPAIGICTSGLTDGGCIPGGSAGGVDGCKTGTSASIPGCLPGSTALGACTTGGVVIP